MKEVLKRRTKKFAIDIIKLTELMPKNTASFVVAKQVIRCSSSVGANYRAALRGRSKAEFIAKLGIVEEEADESMYWLEIIKEADLLKEELVEPLWKEADELTAIFTSMIITAKKNLNNKKS